MSFLLIPVAPLSKSKSRLNECFTRSQLRELTIAMFKDLMNTLSNVNCFTDKIVYCNSPEILELANNNGLRGIKEEISTPEKAFDEIIDDFNDIAVKKYNAEKTILVFLDLVLISANNFYDINALLEQNQLVVCPAIRSAGISVLGRNPPNVISPRFTDPKVPSLFALHKDIKIKGLKKIAVYDSYRAGFDVDIEEDLPLAYEYLKIFNLTHTETYKFLKANLKLSLQKLRVDNNRKFTITKIE